MRICLLFSLAIVLANSLLGADPQPGLLRTSGKQIVAHRGSSFDRPENTIASTLRAIEVGATAVEVDVRRTKDGALVLSHDATLDRTTNGKGAIHDLLLSDIKKLDAGSWFGKDKRFAGERVPTLDEVLVVCKGKIDVLLDLKETGEEYANTVAKAIQKFGEPRRTIVGVRSVEQAAQFRRLLPESRQIGLIAKPDEIESYLDAGVEMIRLWPKWLTDRSLTERIRKRKAKLHLNGTTGEPDEILPLLKHNPDSLSSDNPARLLQTLKEASSARQ